MDLGDIKYLEAPAKVMKLSEAIRIGCLYIEERQLFSGCAIGTAYMHLTGRDLSDDMMEALMKDGYDAYDGPAIVAKAFGIPKHPVLAASNHHYAGRKTRLQCADWLESQGF